MKIKPITHLIIASLLLLLLAFGSYQLGHAHGQPVISVNPPVTAPGDTVTVTGSEMEVGEVFSVSLEGMDGSIKLGEATAVKEAGAEDAGFEVKFTIPVDTAPSSYTLKAATDDGGSATSDLTIDNSNQSNSAGSVGMQEASSAPHILDRSKPVPEMIGIGILAFTSALLGFVLIRSRN